MGLRERKKARTRLALEKAALELFASDGFEATTADDIAARAGVSRSTFFRYFESKESVLFADLQQRLERFREQLAERRPDEMPIHAVRRACLDMARLYMENREVLVVRHRIIRTSRTLTGHDAQLDEAWEAAIAETLGGDTAQQRRDAMLLAGAIIGMIRSGLRDWYDNGTRGDLVANGVRAFELLEASIELDGGGP